MLLKLRKCIQVDIEMTFLNVYHNTGNSFDT